MTCSCGCFCLVIVVVTLQNSLGCVSVAVWGFCRQTISVTGISSYRRIKVLRLKFLYEYKKYKAMLLNNETGFKNGFIIPDHGYSFLTYCAAVRKSVFETAEWNSVDG